MNTIVWQTSPEREAWWQAVVGIERSALECDVTDTLEQSQVVPLDDDFYPHTVKTTAAHVRRRRMTVAAAEVVQGAPLLDVAVRVRLGRGVRAGFPRRARCGPSRCAQKRRPPSNTTETHTPTERKR